MGDSREGGSWDVGWDRRNSLKWSLEVVINYFRTSADFNRLFEMSSSLRATTSNWAFRSLSLFSLDRILIGQFAHLLSLYAIFNFVNRPFSKPQWVWVWAYTAISRKVVGKKCARDNPRKAIWDMMNTLFLALSPVEPTFVANFL